MTPRPVTMPCGHPESAVVQADEGTAYCGECAKAAVPPSDETVDALRRDIIASLIAVKGHLDNPYPDDDRWTPWTRFVESTLQRVDSLAALARTADGLRAELDDVRSHGMESEAKAYHLTLRAVAAEQRAAELASALGFYADTRNWTQPTSWGGRIHDDESRAIQDNGRTAREVLGAFSPRTKSAARPREQQDTAGGQA